MNKEPELLALTLEMPLKLDSVANKRAHWAAEYYYTDKLKKSLQLALNAKLGTLKLTTPAKVVLTRVGRTLDYDNLVSAFKTVRDVIADAIIPGKRPGRADDSPLIEWEYRQEPKNKRPDGFIVQVYQVQAAAPARYP